MYQRFSSLAPLDLKRSGTRATLAVHGAFWGATLLFFALFFGRGAEGYVQSFLFVLLLLPVAMGTTYFLTGFLVPRYLLENRFGLFALYGAYTLLGSIYLELVVIVVTFVFVAEYEVGQMMPGSLDVFGLIVGLYAVVFLALAGNLAVRWHRLRVDHDAAERARLEAELELRQAELARLKMQMQPHFLFNTLNNLYGLTLERSNRAPEIVLRISEMLDYVLYGSARPLVSVRGEIDHIKTYAELEGLRYESRVDIRLDVDDVPDELCIAPLLLTPFVENGFKHGASKATGSSWVHIAVRVRDGDLILCVENGKNDVASNGAGGIGLTNVRRRLELLYPERHDLRIVDLRDRYEVRLRIPTHPCPCAEVT